MRLVVEVGTTRIRDAYMVLIYFPRKTCPLLAGNEVDTGVGACEFFFLEDIRSCIPSQAGI